jgi:hypothetical protein
MGAYYLPVCGFFPVANALLWLQNEQSKSNMDGSLMRLRVDKLVTALSFDRRRVHEIFGEAGFAPVSYHTTRKWAERASIPVNRLFELLIAGKRRGCAVDLTAYVRQEGGKREWTATGRFRLPTMRPARAIWNG